MREKYATKWHITALIKQLTSSEAAADKWGQIKFNGVTTTVLELAGKTRSSFHENSGEERAEFQPLVKGDNFRVRIRRAVLNIINESCNSLSNFTPSNRYLILNFTRRLISATWSPFKLYSDVPSIPRHFTMSPIIKPNSLFQRFLSFRRKWTRRCISVHTPDEKKLNTRMEYWHEEFFRRERKEAKCVMFCRLLSFLERVSAPWYHHCFWQIQIYFRGVSFAPQLIQKTKSQIKSNCCKFYENSKSWL